MSGFCLEFRIPSVACLGAYTGLWSMVDDWKSHSQEHCRIHGMSSHVVVIVARRLLMFGGLEGATF